MNVYWEEQKILLHSEFRDGNVPANFELLRILKVSLDKLPSNVITVYLRADTAAYQEELLQYCAQGEHAQFKKVEFAISAKVTKGLKEAALALEAAAWKNIEKTERQGNLVETKQQWAEVCFTPNWDVQNTSPCGYRYIVIREKMQPLKASQSGLDHGFAQN